MEEDQKEELFQSPPQLESNLRSGKSSSGKKYLFILIAIIIIGLIIFGAVKFFAGSNDSQITDSISPTPTTEQIPTDTPVPQDTGTPTPTEKPSATPKPNVNPVDKSTGLDRSKLSIHVLNGNGTAGASKKAADLLESLGYNVTEMTNADNFNYDQTVVEVTSDKSTYLALLKKDLSGTYTIGTNSATLTGGTNYQALVIVGKQ